jgi:hypothetical protein
MPGVGGRIVADLRAGGRTARLAFAALMAASVGLAYAPSLDHGPRADHWWFLLDARGHRELPDLIAATYSYNRTRTQSPGDTELFRPVLFVLMAAETHLSDGDLRVCQAIGIGLHLGVCLLLYGLLRDLRGVAAAGPDGADAPVPGLPEAATLFFALNPAVQDLVIWSHLHGYLLFLVFLLGSLRLLTRHAFGGRAGDWRSPALPAAWVLTLLAAFTYELGQFYAVFAGGFLTAAAAPRVGLPRAAATGAAFALILAVYQGVNRYDAALHSGRYVPAGNDAAILETSFRPATLQHSVRFFVYTTVQPFWPSLVDAALVDGRIRIPETVWDRQFADGFGPAGIVSAGVLLLTAGLTVAAARGVLAGGDRRWLSAIALPTVLYAAYAGITVLGRMNIRRFSNVLTDSSYYTYFALVFALPIVFALWEAGCRRRGRRPVWLPAGLALLALVGGEQVRRSTQAVAADMAAEVRPVQAVQRFVRDHAGEPDFSIAIDYAQSEPVPEAYGVPVTEIVFDRRISPQPKYRLALVAGRAAALPPAADPR